jgi:hypothetical protein
VAEADQIGEPRRDRRRVRFAASGGEVGQSVAAVRIEIDDLSGHRNPAGGALLLVGDVDGPRHPHDAVDVVAVVAAQRLLEAAIVGLQLVDIAVDENRLVELPKALITPEKTMQVGGDCKL